MHKQKSDSAAEIKGRIEKFSIKEWRNKTTKLTGGLMQVFDSFSCSLLQIDFALVWKSLEVWCLSQQLNSVWTISAQLES